jgi:hypothetical protein
MVTYRSIASVLRFVSGVCDVRFTTKRLDNARGNRSGYLAFYQGIRYDHRRLLLDLPHERIDGITSLHKYRLAIFIRRINEVLTIPKKYLTKAFLSYNIFCDKRGIICGSGPTQK